MKLKRLANSVYINLILVSLLLLTSGNVQASVDVSHKAKLTAAFIYQITKFGRWPESLFADEHQSFSICVLGQTENKLFEYLSALETKSTRGRVIDVVQIKNKQQLFKRAGNNCEVLYSSNEEWQDLSAKEVDQLAQTTLLIGASKRFLEQGGMLALVIVNDKMKILINSLNVANTPIKLESRLKALAKSI